MNTKIGILHPGLMGISVAASAKNSGAEVFWASNGRSPETRERAESQELVDCGSLEALCVTCSRIVSVCPPHAAEDLADQVLAAGFRGLYLDANAIAPQRVTRMAGKMEAHDVMFVDGGIIGGPAWKPGRTWLYLSGRNAERAASCFAAGPLETAIVGSEVGQASALKMCFAAYTKGSTALLSAVQAAAEVLGVRLALEAQWSRGGSEFTEQAHQRLQGVTTKAWRFAGEMDEIAATFESAGMPGGFHQAAAEVYRRMAHFKGMDPLPTVESVLAALQQK